MKIYDCFIFFNELDILELRLNILHESVDFFVIVEASSTHAGGPKPFYYEENKERFKEFHHKIIHHKVYDIPHDFINLPHTTDPQVQFIHKLIEETNLFNRQDPRHLNFGRDFFHKESVRRALSICAPSDLILLSDADEITNPKTLKNLNLLDLENFNYSLSQKMYAYYLNMFKEDAWTFPILGLYKNIKDLSFNELRNNMSLTKVIPDGGWHFSFMGGEKMVKKKLLSYSHAQEVTPHILDSISSNMATNVDPFFRGGLTKTEIDSTFPDYLVRNKEKYSKMIKK